MASGSCAGAEATGFGNDGRRLLDDRLCECRPLATVISCGGAGEEGRGEGADFAVEEGSMGGGGGGAVSADACGNNCTG